MQLFLKFDRKRHHLPAPSICVVILFTSVIQRNYYEIILCNCGMRMYNEHHHHSWFGAQVF